MNKFDLVGYYLCIAMFFAMFWMFGLFATGLTMELTGITELMVKHIPNHALLHGWITGTGGTLFSLAMLKWIKI